MRQIVVNAVTPWVREAMPDLGVNAVRSLHACVCVAIVFGLVGTSSAHAASVTYGTSTVRVPSMSRTAATNQAPQSKPYSSTPQSAVPTNCIRQECGKLWCWQMK